MLNRIFLVMISRISLRWAAVLALTSAASLHAQPTSRDTVVAADVQFMQGMIGHHAQALDMSALVDSRTKRPEMLSLAERIAVSQKDEIAIMRAWLEQKKQPVPATHDMSAHHAGHTAEAAVMPGMLSPAQMDSLGAAQHERFDVLFLRYMIQHHEGALRMVATLLETPRGAHDPQVFQFAADVDADQRAEIRRMRALLDRLVTPAR
ncbi:MAG: DUF305 domain-containing protein [Gemmatimonadaceae bacterium]|nr:DUF305 domain-containing protein [Gemmatimonadaceae bacterium]